MTPAILRIHLLGGLSLAWDDQPVPPPAGAAARSLFAYLLTYRDRPHARALLAGTFWPDLPDEVARRRLRQALWQIRSALAGLLAPVPFLLADADTIQVNPAAPVWLDVDEFLVKAPSPKPKTQTGKSETEVLDLGLGAWGLGLGILREAVALYRGDFLPGVYDDWALLERERLRAQYLDALDRLAAGLQVQGDHEAALGYARRLAAEDPLREEAHRAVMQLCLRLGRPAEALKQYEVCRAILADELGATPAPETTALARQIAAQAEVSPPPPAADADAAPLPLVGRQAERVALLAHVEAALAGRGGLALVEGEAGVGKTRLVQEIAQSAAWRGLTVAWGRAQELAPAPPYSLVTEALQAALSPLRANQLADLVPGIELRAVSRLIPALADWLPHDRLPPHVPLGPAQDRARLLDALADVVLALGQIAPHLFILEDLHWADESTLAALAHLTPRLTGSRVLMIATYRSGEARERPPVWQTMQALDRAGLRERLILDRLDAAAAGELVRRRLGLPAAVPRFEARLYAETQGHPLFLLETLQALRDEGVLKRDAAGAWRTPWDETTTDYAELPLPASVREVIARRLKRLDPPTRAVLDAAAVLGQDLDFATLARLSQLDRAAALTVVSDLVRRRFLAEGPAVYAFSHDLVRRVVYQALGDDERRRLHVQAGATLEALHPAQVESLAHHFDRGNVRDKALAYTLQAGERAEGSYDYPAALAHYERASALAGDDPAARWDALARQEQVLAVLSRREAQARVLDEMWTLAETLNDPARQARTRYRQGWREVLAGESTPALAWLDEAAHLARAAGALDLLGLCLTAAARAWWRIGDAARCQAAIAEARSLFQQTGNRRGELQVLNMLGNLHLGMTGDCIQALAYFEENRRLAHELNDPYAQASAQGNMGIAYALLGGYSCSLEMLAEAFQVMERVGDRQWQGIIRRWQAANYWILGDLAQARAVAEEALAICRAVSERNFEIALLELLGQIALEHAELEQARSYFQQAIAVAQANQQTMDAAINQSHLALAHLYAGQPEEADHLSAQAITTLESLGGRLGRMRTVYLERWQIVAAVAGTEAARPYLERAYQLVQELAAGISDPDLRRSFLENVAENRAIIAAYRTGRLPTPPRRQTVRLPRAAAPTGRPLRDDEYVDVTWTVAAPADDEWADKAARRQARVRRLLAQAQAQGAAPRDADLAAALDVSLPTLRRDVAALHAAGHETPTRGRKMITGLPEEDVG